MSRDLKNQTYHSHPHEVCIKSPIFISRSE